MDQPLGLSVNDFISKSKNQQRQGLKPSGPELIAYARYLGIDPVADHDLLWIAVEALEAPLPSDWTEHFDSNERVFYYNATMRVSSWTHPLEQKYRDTYKQIVNFRNSNMSAQERAEKLDACQMEVKQMEHDVHKEIAQWTEHTDEQGNRFYFNREERQSTWTDPRPAKCQVLYLRMKMLRLLQSGSGAIVGFGDAKGGMEAGHGGHGSHGGHNSHGLGSRFAGASHENFEADPAHKRPKVSTGRPAEQGGGGGPFSDEDEGGGGGGGRYGPESLSEPEPSSGSESDDEGKRKKKKKKKKKKHRQDANSAAPPRPGGGQMRASQSEPAVGASPSGHQGLQALGFDHADSGLGGREGLNPVGRTRVKPGIRLEPLAPIAGPGGGPLAPLDPVQRRAPQGSASVPALQP